MKDDTLDRLLDCLAEFARNIDPDSTEPEPPLDTTRVPPAKSIPLSSFFEEVEAQRSGPASSESPASRDPSPTPQS